MLVMCVQPIAALACGARVCIVDPETLSLPRQITFDTAPSGQGPGYLFDDLLILDGAGFGERFAGQTLNGSDTHDGITGAALRPLTLLAGAAGQNLSVVAFMGISVLNGYGPRGYPHRDGQGEGAIAILFDDDQSEISIHFRGGESGSADALFLDRSGGVLARVPITPLGETVVGFARAGTVQDIAGIVLTNTDPQGLAIDTIRFGKSIGLG